ncbi:MAG: hypothetical protein EPO26_11595 [Chloroflexota bacterium]|nr:MAG: hypothetical protein EPO26_11595 [Chloroflexota bacterium]
MMAIVRSIHSPDLLDMRAQQPVDPGNFRILVQALIGPEDSDAADSFEWCICTPRWLESHLSASRYEFGHGYLVVNHYSYQLIADAIESLCEAQPGTTWAEVAGALGRYGRWEFQGYEVARRRSHESAQS